MRNFLFIIILSVFLSGCGTIAEMFLPRQIVLHPIEKSDIFFVASGTQIGDARTEKAGVFLSQEYLDEVLKVRIQK